MNSALKLLALLACLGLATFYIYQIHGAPPVGIDDANIFFTYSHNLAAGKGIVYANNPEPVEGFTSLAWMLICALLFAAGFSETAVLIVSVLLLVGTHAYITGLIGRIASANGRSSLPYQLAYVFFIILSAPYMTWMTITLMDTCLWGLVVAIIAGSILSPPERASQWLLPSMVIVAAPVVRPESMLVVPFALSLLWRYGVRISDDTCLRATRSLFVAFLAIMAVLTGFRLWYFGYPLPNTYYAKVSPSLIYNISTGFDYLVEFLGSGILVGIGTIVLIVLVILNALRRLQQPALAASSTSLNYQHYALFCLLLFVLPVLTGGDHFAMSRFLQPVFPLLCLALVIFFIEIRPSQKPFVAFLYRHGAVVLILLALLDCVLFAWGNGASLSSWRWESPIDNEFRIAEKGIALGIRLNSLFAELPVKPGVAVIPAGGIARSYSGPIIDLLGLNDLRFSHYQGKREGMRGHASFEKEPFFSICPDILIGVPPGADKGTWFTNDTLKGLLLEPAFAAQYRYGSLARVDFSDLQLTSFFSLSFLAAVADYPQLKFTETMRFDGTSYVKLAH
ncbi:MAG: hypothetical protein A2W80_17545 [Candidatus Riflebacteria bacterium GWC2_50_8]|nr:MAG: hypothetical protein A2W80_17545 [Candidatus Riflebacteria bacterium GWC2_50_8]